MERRNRYALKRAVLGIPSAKVIALGLSSTALLFSSAFSFAGAGVDITFAHSGDFHGDYHSHTNGRGDAAGKLEGGIARAVTVLEGIRAGNTNVIHVHTGDTIHGSGEASITKGMALVRMVDKLGIDVSTPGNWEWAYTPYRYMQLFGVHDSNGNNMDIVDDAVFNTSIYKAVRYSKTSAYTEDNIGDVGIDIASGDTEFRTVKYVASYNLDGTPNMAEGTNRWGMVASNVYENGTKVLDHGVVSKGTGMNLTPPYRIIEKDGVKIGFIGCTTNRGPQVVSSTITVGVAFSNCKGGIKFPQNRPIDWENVDTAFGGNKTGAAADSTVMAGNRNDPKDGNGDWDADWATKPHWGGTAGYKVVSEIVKWTNHLRNVENVDLVAVMSEAGIAENIYAAENLTGMANGPDIYFSSDMHEETNFPVVVTDKNFKKVIIVENSEDIAQIGQLNVTVHDGAITAWSFVDHDVNEDIAEDSDMADLANQIDQEIADKITDGAARNPYNNHLLTYQLTDVVGETNNITLERNRFTTEFNPDNNIMPGIIEGTGHDLVTDMFRKLTGADVAGLRGFRYTNSVLSGDEITYKSLYHFFPIGAQVAVGSIPTTPTSEATAADGTVTFLDKTDDDKFIHGGQNPTHFISFPRSLQQEMELAGNSTMNPNIPAWGGGWFWNYSGVKFDMQPTGPQFDKWGTKPSARISNIVLYDNPDNRKNGAIDEGYKASVQYASYYYHEDFNRINRNQLVTKGKCTKNNAFPGLTKECVVAKGDIQILAKAADGDYVMVDALEYDAGIANGDLAVLDAVEALGRYISSNTIPVYDWDGSKGQRLRTVRALNGKFQDVGFEYPRITLVDFDGNRGVNDLTDCSIEFGFPCIQPMRGAEAALNTTVPAKPDTFVPGRADIPALSGTFN